MSTTKYLLVVSLLTALTCDAIQIKDASSENITILHEVRLDLNTHEVLPTKATKKKPYAVHEEQKLKPVTEVTADHAVAFDFNLDDLEDVHGLNNDEYLADRVSTEPSPNIYKVVKSKGGKNKVREDFRKHVGSNFNSINRRPGYHENSTADGVSRAEGLVADTPGQTFQTVSSLYDHFYWQSDEIRQKVSPVCGVELLSYLTALNSNLEWAQRVYDTSGHFRGQFMFGNNKWLGQRRFCDAISSGFYSSNRKHFDVGFFVATIRIKARLPWNLTTDIQLGECLPTSCSARDVQAILELDPHARALDGVGADAGQVRVLRVKKVPGTYLIWKDAGFLVFSTIIATIILTIIIATWYESTLPKSHKEVDEEDRYKQNGNATNGSGNGIGANGKAFELYQISGSENVNNTAENGNGNGNAKKPDTGGAGEHKKKELAIWRKMLLCFAFQSNADTILTLKSNSKELVSCVHGLRVLSVLWTILVHTYLEVFSIGENRDLRKITETWFLYQMVGNATFSVDTFFFISGLLVTLLFFRQANTTDDPTAVFVRKSAVQSGFLLAYRYLRLTPAYAFVIAFNEFVVRFVQNRAVIELHRIQPDACSDYWWRNVLYINNFYPFQEMCMIWSWYMANDMQFYILAIVLLVASTRYFRVSFLVLVSYLITSWAVSGVISIYFNYEHKVDDPFESFDFLYDKPWQRIGPYIVGMMTGYVIHKIKTPPKVSFGVNLLLWTASLGLLFIIIFGVWNGRLSVLATAFYVSVGHSAFALALVWIVLSCSWGLANPAKKFLSYEGWKPLSRLTYCTYLIHPVIMIITQLSMEGTITLDHSLIYILFLGNAVVSFTAAFFISICFEAPVIRMLKIVFKK